MKTSNVTFLIGKGHLFYWHTIRCNALIIV